MPMKNKAGGCNCCGASPCSTCTPTTDSGTHDSTQTMEGSTYYRYDMPGVTSDNIFLTSYQVKFVVFEISNGDWYRISYADVPLFGATATTSIEKSTDSGATWVVQKDIYTAGSSQQAYEEACRCGSESPALAATHVSSRAITNEKNVCFYGENSSGCYLGLTNILQDYTVSDADFLNDGTGTQSASIWDSSAGRGVFTSEVAIEIAGETIGDVYLMNISSGTKNWKYVRLGTYSGYNCATEADPNCGCVCAAAFPGISLNVTSMAFTVGGSVSKTVTIDGSFSASDDYCNLDSLDGFGISEFSSGAALTTVGNYVSTSQPEFSGVGVVRESCGNNAGYYDPRSAGRDTTLCQASGYIFASEECEILDSWFAEYQKTTPLGSDTYGPQSGSNVGATLEYSWTANGGGTDLTALSSSVSATYDGGFYQSTDVRDKRASMELTVTAETDCTVTLQLVVTDFQLQHGITTEITSGTPIWEKTATVTWTGSKADYDFDVSNHWNPPDMQGVKFGQIETVIEPDTANHGGSSPWYENHTNEYAFHVDNGAATGESQALAFRTEASLANAYTISETGTRLDPEWTAWEVTFEKTVNKSTLASGTVTINFTSSDITSTNHSGSRSTFAPFDNSGGYAIANQYNSLGLFTPSGSNYHSLVTVLKPSGYSTKTVSLSQSDWSASVTLKRAPFYS